MLPPPRATRTSMTTTQLDETMASLLRGINMILALDARRQVKELFEVCQIKNYPFTYEQLRSELPTILGRYAIFKELPKVDQYRYLVNLIDWRQSVGKDDVVEIGLLLPGLCPFICTIRSGNYPLW
ncbi:hypothetical protein F5Y06DRAFT_296446 [Hypoxylon sp. FL0890]|nr:hypothetical protein F5Y06DRAFT_296446 [Hypoxylon sp. FL0890]